jgi:Putative motility protein
MEINSIPVLANYLTSQQMAAEVSTAVLKKSLDTQKQMSTALIQSLNATTAAMSSTSYPGVTLGQNIDVYV